MNILKNIIALSLLSSTVISASVQADELMDIIYPEMADSFQYDGGIVASEPEGIFSLNDDYSKQNTWSYEYEAYVDQSDFVVDNNINDPGQVNRYIEQNPTASGKKSEPVFKWDSVYDGYMVY